MTARQEGILGLRIALIALVGAGALASIALIRALQIEEPIIRTTTEPGLQPATLAERDTVSLEAIMAAVEVDPFHPERRRPSVRFRLPSERRAMPRRVARRPSLPPSTKLTGTMVYPDGGGVAVLRRGGSSVMVRVGEKVGDLTLRSVEREQAVFTASSGARVVVRVSKPGG